MGGRRRPLPSATGKLPADADLDASQRICLSQQGWLAEYFALTPLDCLGFLLYGTSLRLLFKDFWIDGRKGPVSIANLSRSKSSSAFATARL